MKKAFGIILVLVVLAFFVWLLLHHPAETTNENTAPPKPMQTTNSVVAPIISNVLPQPPPQQPATNAFVRPDSIDEDHWNQLMLVRQLALEQNQPVEFYARIEDGNGNPVEGAKLQVTLSRINEKMFETTNFFRMNMGDEIVHTQLKLLSDAGGWIRFTNMTGKALWVESLSKEGYSWTMPQIDSFAYEPNRHRTVGYAEMRDAFNPDKGYVFHLLKN